MKTAFYCILFLFAGQLTCFAQYQPEWAFTLDEKPSNLHITKTATGENNHIYALGYYNDTEIAGRKLENQGPEKDLILFKMTEQGQILWEKRIGGLGSEFEGGLAYYDNNVYISLRVTGNYNVDSGNETGVTEGTEPMVLASFDINGNLNWQKQIETTGEIQPRGVSAGTDGFYVTGYFMGQSDFSAPENSSTVYEATSPNEKGFLAKYDFSGNLLWVNVLNCNGETYPGDLDLMDDAVYITGLYGNTLNTEGETGILSSVITAASTTLEYFLIKFSSEGNLLWARRFAQSEGLFFPNLRAANEKIVVSGVYKGLVNFNTPSAFNGTNELTSTEFEVFLSCFDDSGTLNWISRYGPTGSTQSQSDLQIAGDQVLICGNENGILNFSTPAIPGFREYDLTDRDAFLASFSLQTGDFISCVINKGLSAQEHQTIAVTANRQFVFGTSSNQMVSTDINGLVKDSVEMNSQEIFAAAYEIDLLPDWQKSYGNVQAAGSEAISITSDTEGNTYTVGYFHDFIQFGSLPVLFARGSKDMYVVKHNAEGKAIWSVRAGGTGDEEVSRIIFRDNWLYLTGSFEGVANFSSPYIAGSLELTSAGGKDIFLIKMRPLDGTLFLLKRAGGPQNDEGKDLTTLGTDIYFTGLFRGKVNFNTPSSAGSNELESVGQSDIFLAKFNSSGNAEWLRRAGGVTEDQGVAIDASGSVIYVGGNFTGTANFNTPSATGSNEITSEGLQDMFLAKFSTGGSLNFVRRAGGVSEDELYNLATSENDVFLTGQFSGTASFPGPASSNVNLVSNGARDGFLIKYSSVGIPQWRRRMGGNLNDGATAISIHNDRINLTGFFRAQIDFNYDTTTWPETYLSDGARDVFLATYDLNGTLIRTKRAGGPGEDLAKSISSDDFHLWICGSSDQSMNFNTPSSALRNFILPEGSPYGFISGQSIAPDLSSLYKTGKEQKVAILSYKQMTASDNGDVYILGQFTENLKIKDLDLPHSGNTDEKKLFLYKADSKAKPVFLSHIASSFAALITKLVHYQGNLYVLLQNKDAVTLKKPDGDIYYDNEEKDNYFYLLKYDLNGNLIWSKRQKGDARIFDVDASGIYIADEFSGSVEFETGSGTSSLSSLGNTDIYVLKYDLAGNYVWARRYGGINSDRLETLEVKGNDIFLTGEFQESMSFNTPGSLDPPLLKVGNIDQDESFVIRLNSLGDLQWAKRFSANQSYPVNFQNIIAANNLVYLVGINYYSSLDYSNPYNIHQNPIIRPKNDAYLAIFCYDLAGNFLWAKTAGDTLKDSDLINVSSTVIDGNLVLAGAYQNSINFSDPFQPNTDTMSSDLYPWYNTYLVSYSSSGNLLSYQGIRSLIGSSYVFNTFQANGNLYLHGSFSYFSEFNEINYSPENNGFLDLIKLRPCSPKNLLQSTADDMNFGYHQQVNPAGQTLTAQNLLSGEVKVSYKADAILLEPGFQAQSGTVFSAVSGNCSN